MPANRLVVLVVVVIVITPSVVLGVSGTFPPVKNNYAGAVPNLKKPRIPGFSELGLSAPQGQFRTLRKFSQMLGPGILLLSRRPRNRGRALPQ